MYFKRQWGKIFETRPIREKSKIFGKKIIKSPIFVIFLRLQYYQPMREEIRTILAVEADNGIDCPKEVTGTFLPHEYHVIFPWTRPAVIKDVYLRMLPKVWAIHLAKASDTMGFVIVGLGQHQDLFNCISHQAAVPLILELTECLLAWVFERPNKQSWGTISFSHICTEVWRFWPRLPTVLQ